MVDTDAFLVTDVIVVSRLFWLKVILLCLVIYRTEGSRKPQGVNVESPEVTVISNVVRETVASDSDSDGPVLYKDEEEEDEDDEYTSSMWFLLWCSITKLIFWKWW